MTLFGDEKSHNDKAYQFDACYLTHVMVSKGIFLSDSPAVLRSPALSFKVFGIEQGTRQEYCSSSQTQPVSPYTLPRRHYSTRTESVLLKCTIATDG
jgi:hypothetical protein